MSDLQRPGRDGGPEDEADLPEPPQLRRLRLLVSVLMLVLIGGMITVALTLVIRLGGVGPAAAPPTPVEASRLALPAGHDVIALGRSGVEIMVFTRGPGGEEALRIFDVRDGGLRSVTEITRE